jgi:FkbM family methyltransferase
MIRRYTYHQRRPEGMVDAPPIQQQKQRQQQWASRLRLGLLMSLCLVVGWHLSSRPPSPVSKRDELWWQPYLQQSLAKGPLHIPLMPFNVSMENDKAVLQVLQHFGFNPKQQDNLTIIDIGLPSESILFAQKGYNVQAFEARAEGIQRVQKAYAQQPIHVQQRIHLHHTALSNVSNTTLFMYDALDSSSLLESAVQARKEKPKFEMYGQRMEQVPVERLDHFIIHHRETRNNMNVNVVVVAIKIDTQGVESEIFMGSRQLLLPEQQRQQQQQRHPPVVILTEYCTRLRAYEELRIGPHLLDGLGYTCYLRPTSTFSEPLVLDANLEYCGDLVCIHQWAETRMLLEGA